LYGRPLFTSDPIDDEERTGMTWHFNEFSFHFCLFQLMRDMAMSFAAAPTGQVISLDFTEIDQGLNLWSEIFPMIEKEIATLTSVAQEMQECPGKQAHEDNK
jgi:hypothetical protein